MMKYETGCILHAIFLQNSKDKFGTKLGTKTVIIDLHLDPILVTNQMPGY